MYQLQDSVSLVKGVGQNSQSKFAQQDIQHILDLLFYLPLRYEDRSNTLSIAEIQNLTQEQSQLRKNQINKKVSENFVTTKAKVLRFNEYHKGRLLISRATIVDETGSLNCIWFNNKFLKSKLTVGQEFFFSGEFKNNSLVQATVEKVATENLHTGRLVPIYSTLADLKQGNLRRLLAEVFTNLNQAGELGHVLKSLHFPKDVQEIIQARERLALEEMIYLIQVSAQHKASLQKKQSLFSFPDTQTLALPKLPFALTTAQERAIHEIFADLSLARPMNRLLVGDVGSGKTIVAAIPAIAMLQKQQNVFLIAPTKILAQQHYQKLQKIFPDSSFALVDSNHPLNSSAQAGFYIGTHVLLKHLATLKPSLVIYDEQQRFGVKHRQFEEYLATQKKQPHLLSMTATPIPRSLMLSIFSHLDVSYLDQMPQGREMATTWLVPKAKEAKALAWLVKALTDSQATGQVKQALVICPFINPSAAAATENVAAVRETVAKLQTAFTDIYQQLHITDKQQLKLAALHSKLKQASQAKIVAQVYAQKIQVLVSTSMIEVGVDLPNADIILIQSAERFGLSSLHQMRGRVGRQGQKSYCLLFTSDESDHRPEIEQRLTKFCQEKDGLKLAQLDLENRGAGDLLGYRQSGFNSLHFASWANSAIIAQAQQVVKDNPKRQSILATYLEKINREQQVKTATN